MLIGELGLEPGDLDELVHDAFSRQASQTNNGPGSQVRFLAGYYGTSRTRSLISDLQPGTARPASAGDTAVLQPARNTAHRQPLASSARQPRPSSCRAARRTGGGPACS